MKLAQSAVSKHRSGSQIPADVGSVSFSRVLIMSQKAGTVGDHLLRLVVAWD